MNENIISKELLGSVMGFGIYYVGKNVRNKLTYTRLKENNMKAKTMNSINIHSLAFKIRDYFNNRGHHLSLDDTIEDIFKNANKLYENIEMEQ